MEYPSCVQSGYCCTKAPCHYGKSGDDGACIYLLPPDTLGRRSCDKYEYIVEHEKGAIWPMMGSGCSSTLYNSMRESILLGQQIVWDSDGKPHVTMEQKQ